MGYQQRSLAGIGGWLAFFIVTLVLNALGSLIQPLVLLSTSAPIATGAGWHAYAIALGTLCVAKAAGYGYLAWRFNARQVPSTVRIGMVGLWTLALVPALVDAAAASTLLSFPPGQIWTLAAAEAARPIGYSAIWTAYLYLSERVANTYTPDMTEGEELAGVFQ